MKTITCDDCSLDLTSTGNTSGWRLVIRCEELPRHKGAPLTDIWIESPISEPLYFCGWRCLKAYMQALNI